MTEDELSDALDGLHAYDSGCIGSGIHDPMLKQRVRAYLASLSSTDRRHVLARIARDLYLTDRRIEQGYGLEDVVGFGRWLDDEGMLL